MAQWDVVSALHVLLDPIVHTQVVEPVAGLGIVRMSRRKSDLPRLRLQDAGKLLKTSGQLYRFIIAVEEIHHALHPIKTSLAKVDGLEVEALDKLPERI